jgi:hypothetical protein
LTKIIIGLGLVEFQTLSKYLYDAASYAAAFVAQKPITEAIASGDTTKPKVLYDRATASPFFFALIITSLVSASIFAYLETRTRLTLLFVGAFQETRSGAASAGLGATDADGGRGHAGRNEDRRQRGQNQEVPE